MLYHKWRKFCLSCEPVCRCRVQVWVREFDHGFVVVSSIQASNYTVALPVPVRDLPLSSNRQRLTGQRESGNVFWGWVFS